MGAVFQVPDFGAPLNVEERLSAVPKARMTKGMFIQGMIETAEFAGHDVTRFGKYIPFKEYPVVDYMQVCVEVAKLVYPKSPPRVGLRMLGRQVYPKFLSSRLGRAIFGMALGEFDRVIDLAPRAYAQVQGSTLTITEKKERSFIGEMRGVWAFPECMQVGVWEGAMDACGAHGEIKIRIHSGCDVDFLCEWK